MVLGNLQAVVKYLARNDQLPMTQRERPIQSGSLDDSLVALYGDEPSTVDAQRKRYERLLELFEDTFPGRKRLEIFSTPGRTEVGGNHTDHNAGRVLAAAIDLDIVAVVAPNDEGIIRIRSDEYAPVDISVDELVINESERFEPASLARGVCAGLAIRGFRIGGFDAVTHSVVPEGSGLSSSAAFEVMVTKILSVLYNDDAVDALTNAQISQYAENTYFGKPCGLMDQTTCAIGGLVTIDFQDDARPAVQKIEFDFRGSGYEIVVVNTGGSHADLTPDYAGIRNEMQAVAGHLGGRVLRDVSPGDLMENLASVRRNTNDRAVLRALHFFDDNERVEKQVKALEENRFSDFLDLVVASGRSSWMLLQNCYSDSRVEEQGIPLALALSERLLKGKGAWRVHGGGFAGTVQAFMPVDTVPDYTAGLEAVFGRGSCHPLTIRPQGASHVGTL